MKQHRIPIHNLDCKSNLKGNHKRNRSGRIGSLKSQTPREGDSAITL